MEDFADYYEDNDNKIISEWAEKFADKIIWLALDKDWFFVSSSYFLKTFKYQV